MKFKFRKTFLVLLMGEDEKNKTNVTAVLITKSGESRPSVRNCKPT